MPQYLNYNGTVFSSQEAIITADNRGLRYGDGLFETMKLVDGTISLASYHYDRLFTGLRLLKFNESGYFTPAFLSEQIFALSIKNGHRQLARVRLMIFRGKGGLYDAENHDPNYIIQTFALDAEINTEPARVDVYPHARKPVDSFANLKSNNYLPYLMGALYATEKKLDDCFILNSTGNICDTTIANVFMIKDERIYTPQLSDGCVAGVMRRHLLEKLFVRGNEPEEKSLTVEDLLGADEIFLTNSIYGVRPVGSFRSSKYSHTLTARMIIPLAENPGP